MPEGWMSKNTETTGRPKARFFGFLSVMWIILGICAAMCLSLKADDPEFYGVRRLSWVILAAEPVFIGLAIYFRFAERPKKLTVPTTPGWDGMIIH